MKWLTIFFLICASLMAQGTTPPDNKVKLGDPTEMFVVVEGTPPIRYQWYKDGVAIVGETTSVLKFPALSQADVGRYYVTATNDYGTATSNDAFVRIITAPSNAKIQFLVGTPTF